MKRKQSQSSQRRERERTSLYKDVQELLQKQVGGTVANAGHGVEKAAVKILNTEKRTGKRTRANFEECIDAVDAAISDLEGVEAHYTASAIQYLWRWKSKGGVEDLQKAQWYVSRLIETVAL